VNFTCVPHHTQIVTVFRFGTWDDTPIYSDYVLCPDVTEFAVQDATPTKSYGNFGLDLAFTVAESYRGPRQFARANHRDD